MTDAGTRGAIGIRTARWALHASVVVACGSMAVGSVGGTLRAYGAEGRELPILPTVHPTLSPTSAIPVPLKIAGGQTSVWRSNLEQRMLVTGGVRIEIGYRSLRAQNAAIWLTPSKEAGESSWDVAIFLQGNVQVLEGGRLRNTATSGKELLVTTRISRSIELSGTPVSRAEENNPVFRRGQEIRDQIESRPPAQMYIPQITVSSIEQALQAGWIARGPNNRIVAGPGDFQLAKGPNGKYVPVSPTTKPAKPSPIVRIAQESTSQIHVERSGNETIAIFHQPYVLYDALDGKPPLEFHAERAVAFLSPQPGTATEPASASLLSRSRVTGIYLEGDVVIDAGAQVKGQGKEQIGGLTIRASRIYYDFLSQRAVMLDSTLSTVDETRNVPLYMRAKEIRQLARGEYAAKDASFSTSEFHTPHYSIGASDIYLQDITPQQIAAPGAGQPYDPNRGGAAAGPQTYAFKAKNTTLNVQGVPIFWWPYLSGDTSNNDIPLRHLRVGNSRSYGLSLETGWDLFGVAGQPKPKNVTAELDLDYFSKRGPAGGVNADWGSPDGDSHGLLRSYGLEDRGTDRLGRDRTGVNVTRDERGQILARHQQVFGDGWTLNLEGSYISDPNFLQQYFGNVFQTDKGYETSAYLKHQGDTDAVTLLGKFSLFDFTSVANQIDDQFFTEKKPEAKYYRIGDSFFDMFTYYSESGVANLHQMFTNYTPAELALTGVSTGPFLGLPAEAVSLSGYPTMTFRDFYTKNLAWKRLLWTNRDVARADSRQEIDMPLSLGDVKVTPYVTGRVTAWDDAFPESESGSTTRLWGQAGVRAATQFWRVYDDVESTFWDVHEIRHVIEPQFVAFGTAADESRNDLQPFDRDVESISRASGTSVSLNQRWQTKRGGPGHWRDVDWITLNVQWNQFWSRERSLLNNLFYIPTARGMLFPSRPELSLIQNSLDANATWRVGERVRLLGEASYDTENARLVQAASGVAIDQTNSLSYFLGNRYVEIPNYRFLNPDRTSNSNILTLQGYTSNELTAAVDYRFTRKYELLMSESYDLALHHDILSSVTLIRRLPRFNVALTASYDSDNADTTFSFSMYPEGFPELGIGSGTASAMTQR